MNKQIDIKELLDWYIMAGVEETCGIMPCLGLENANLDIKTNLPNNQISENTNNQPKPSFVSVASKNAMALCQNAQSIDDLKDILQKFEGCGLKKTAASTILGEGSIEAKIMLIGEAPGADEDRIGRPFVGRCGQLLDKMLCSISLNREECYITNVLPWRPPGNRTPTDEELAVCLPFVKRQIELIKPDFILLLGKIALKSVLDTPESVSRVRGKWFEYDVEDKKIQVLATFHPSYLLRSTAQKSKTWVDLLRLKNKLNEKN